MRSFFPIPDKKMLINELSPIQGLDNRADEFNKQ
jgi:hypothetical protein